MKQNASKLTIPYLLIHNLKSMNHFSETHLLKLAAKKKTVVRNIRRDPEFYQVGGTCCWKVFAKRNHRGQGAIIRRGIDRQRNTFKIKSVKLVDCEQGQDNPGSSGSGHQVGGGPQGEVDLGAGANPEVAAEPGIVARWL